MSSRETALRPIEGGRWRPPRRLTHVNDEAAPLRAPYSAAALAGSTNCDTQELRRFTLARYISSNSAAGKECVDGRFMIASVHAFSRGYFSSWPILWIRSRNR